MVRQLWRRMRREELGRYEWRLSSLSRRLQVSETRLRDWLRRGWLAGRKVGRTWIAVADEQELARLSALSAYQTEHGRFHPYPSELITPSGQ